MKMSAQFLIVLLLISNSALLAEETRAVIRDGADGENGFQSMLNGKDLTGWVLTNTPAETWSFRDGMLICSGKPIGEMRTAVMYQNFIMEVEWRHMKPRGNAGIFIWADDITARGQPFHRGIEVQVLEDAYGNSKGHTVHGDIFPIHGAKMTPINGRGGGRAFPTENRSRPSPQWNHYRIECNDGNISLAVNGKVVTRGTKCWPKKGYICIESEGGIVHYRNMKIKVLPDTPIDDADVAIANRGFRSLYTGLDFSGWNGADGSAWKSKDWVLGHSGDTPSSITTSTPYGDFGFVFDIRLQDKDSKASVKLRNSNIAQIDLSAKAVQDTLEKTGRWNRFDGEIRGNKMTLTVNGQTVYTSKQLPGVNTNGPIELMAVGSVDFSNIYIRK